MGKSLYNKVFDNHIVRELAPGQYQIFLGLHLVHEVTSPQAFQMLRESQQRVAYPNRTFATADHVIPTQVVSSVPEETTEMLAAIEKNTSEFAVRYFAPGESKHGIVHVLGPEQGLTQPGMTIACGDSHTSTHGAFGSLAFGIGTTQVRDVLATQTMIMHRLKVRQIKVNGRLPEGVYAKDLALYLLNRLGTAAGVGYAYEFEGEAVRHLNMDERMTLCNLAVEMGARCGYVNPCNTTFAYLKDKPYAPTGADWDRAVAYWKSVASDPDAEFDDVVEFDASEVQPMVTWGITPAQSVAIHESIPDFSELSAQQQNFAAEALDYMGFVSGQKVEGTSIQVAFIGSCTNGRYSDLAPVGHALARGRFHVASGVRALVVPGSFEVSQRLKAEGLDRIFTDAGFEFRSPGCSMCLAMNEDRLEAGQVCASSSNRNFKGRQGSPTGKTLLMSPMMVAAAAIQGAVTDARQLFGPSQTDGTSVNQTEGQNAKH